MCGYCYFCFSDHKKPEGGVVSAHGAVTENALKAAPAGHHATGNALLVPDTRRPSLASAAMGFNTLRSFDPSGEHTLSKHPIYTLARRRGQPTHRSMIEVNT